MERHESQVRVRLKLFGTYRRYLPLASAENTCQVEVPAGTPVLDFLAQLGVPIQRGTSVVLVNGRDAPLEQELEEGDVVAVFPALAGG